MSKKRILVVVGTRPNFIKITQFRKAASAYPDIDLKILHTGQHFDEKMADVFFRQLKIQPDYFLGIGQGTPNTQMAMIMLKLEEICMKFRPDLIMVTGDVNSTFAASLTANKLNTKLAHVESGLRSFDRTMPEEFNRILTDVVSDILFVTEPSGLENLRSEGVDSSRIHFVGNTMIDTMVAFTKEIDSSDIMGRLGLDRGKFVLMTMHRPATVDHEEGLRKLLKLIRMVTEEYKLVFPIHPRTRKMAATYGLEGELSSNAKLLMTEPMDYFAFQNLVKNCAFIITDSGGIQEESTFLGVPCLTLRPNTERPVTVTEGTNELLPFDLSSIEKKIAEIRNGKFKKGRIPELWDGKASERIFKIISQHS